jgi:hypothetical protein
MAQAKVDLSEFYRLSSPKKKPCRVGFAREQIKTDELEQLDAALAADHGIITNSAVVQWLAARKHDVSVSAVVSHRKGTCTCKEAA